MSSPFLHASFASAYDDYADAIFRHCAFRVFDRERAKELMQETFLKVWEYIASGKEVDNMRPFLYRTANNLIIDEARRRKRRTVESLEDLQEKGWDLQGDDGSTMGVPVDQELVMRALEAIEEPYRTAVIMRYIDELSPREIAEILGETANAVSVRINRGTEKLRRYLKRDER